MKVYHATTLANAAAIDQGGFLDSRPKLWEGQDVLGVPVADVPLWELWDPPDRVVYQIEFDPMHPSAIDCTEPAKGFREWLVPASILNGCRREKIDR